VKQNHQQSKTKKIMKLNANVKKCLVILGMTIGFWIASLFIKGLVNDRSNLSDETQKEISATWGSNQKFIGPILCVPLYNDSALAPYTCMYVLPNQNEDDVNVESETLHRGIFDATVYRAQINATGSFDLREMVHSSQETGSKTAVRYDWSHAQIITAIGDKRGIEQELMCEIGSEKVELNRHFDCYGSTRIKSALRSQDEVCSMVDLSQMVGKEVHFNLTTCLKGSGELNVAPIGKNNHITLRGNCSDPSFMGMALPSERQVTDSGFTATWLVNCLNRNDVDQVFDNTDESKTFQTIGARLLVSGGQYTQTDRALKYAFLVILLSLAAVYVAEMSVRSEINAMNYLLIGVALVLFYLILISLGERIGFTGAYCASAVLVLGMIAAYLKAIVHKGLTALAVCLFMLLIDIFIYVLLSLADMALLVGTMGLFVLLGAAMYFSLRFATNKPQALAEE